MQGLDLESTEQLWECDETVDGLAVGKQLRAPPPPVHELKRSVCEARLRALRRTLKVLLHEGACLGVCDR